MENQNQKNQIENNSHDEVILNTSNEHLSANVSVEDTAKKVHAKREKNKNLRIFLFSIIGFCCLIVGAFLVLKHFRDLKQYTYTEEYPLYQYFAGNKEVYNGKVTLSSDDDITKIESNGVVKDIEDAPIYFQKVENEVLTSKNMLLVFPRLNNKNYKMKMFSKVVYENDSNAAFYYLGNQKIYLEDSFLYDGNDLYLFLYKTVITVGNTDYELSPLSFVIVDYQDQVEIYDKEKDEYIIIEKCDTDVLGNMSNYKINLSTDMINDNRLLLKSVDKLPLYKK